MDNNFNKYSLCDELLKAISLLNYKAPTEVQDMAIPAILQQKDVIIKSETGSGKTAAFAIPLCELINWEDNEVQAIVLTPTRELAIQVSEDIFNIGRFKRIKTSCLYGGESFARQVKELKQKTHIVVGTPGRVLDHLLEGTLNTSNVNTLIIDEADEMLNMGFIEEVETVIARISDNRTTVLVSATFNKKIDKIINKHMLNPIKIETTTKVSTMDNITYLFYKAKESTKQNLLRDITMIENPDSCIIFCNTKIMVDDIDDFLYNNGYSCMKIHGGMEQRDRTSIMNRFKQNEFRYLVATDVAARGIDVDDISLIINYDMPDKKDSFIHRTGRTGRRGKNGKAISLVSEIDQLSFANIKESLGLDHTLLAPPDALTVDKCKDTFYKKSQKQLEIKETKGAKLSEDILKIHINAGKKTKMRAMDIVGTLCSIKGMTADDIGIINILDVSTFVEVLNGKGEFVLKTLQTKNIKGRPRTVTKADLPKKY